MGKHAVSRLPSSWGNTIHSEPRSVIDLGKKNVADVLQKSDPTFLPYGMGRSYGDVCLNNGGTLLRTDGLHKVLEFDENTGRIRVESGASISHVLDAVVPKGWFIPVIPGTSQITIGGAVANDVHGKNHHGQGTFGCHVLSFELIRFDGQQTICSLAQHSDLFRATIGGLGLTGLITWVELQLMPLHSTNIEMRSTACTSWQDLVRVLHDEDQQWEYTVAWVDIKRGRGHVLAGKHSRDGNFADRAGATLHVAPLLRPFLNDVSADAFNRVKFLTQRKGVRTSTVHYRSYFHPLDVVPRWNKMYGRKGFFQYQFVVPHDTGVEVISSVSRILSQFGIISYLAVLKNFGGIASPGMLSFPMRGLTLALDVPNHGNKTLEALAMCDEILLSSGGRIYPAKDARMSANTFNMMYRKQLQEFTQYIDPKFSSSFWRRVGAAK